MDYNLITELNGDLSDREFTRRLTELLANDPAPDWPETTLSARYIESYGGAWLQVTRGHCRGQWHIYPVTRHEGLFFQGDHRKRGQCGISWYADDGDGPLMIVRRRATRMAKGWPVTIH